MIVTPHGWNCSAHLCPCLEARQKKTQVCLRAGQLDRMAQEPGFGGQHPSPLCPGELRTGSKQAGVKRNKRCCKTSMMTIGLIALGAWALLTVLFVVGLAAAAGRPIPEVDNVVEFPVQQTQETLAGEKIVAFNKAA